MEDVDDDFGELYADVEIQAISAINCVPSISQSYIKQQPQQQKFSDKLGDESLDVSHSTKNGSEVDGDEGREKGLEGRNERENDVGVESGSESDSDDDDDFDVVVNDDDFMVRNGVGDGREGRNVGEDEENEFVAMGMEGNSTFNNQERADVTGMKQSGTSYGGERRHVGKNGCDSQYKFVRQYGSVSIGNQRVINSSRGNREDLGYIQNRRTSLGRVGPSYAAVVPGLSEHSCGFWLPWNRTILDVDIDMFEQKPWTLPGADMTDYFNFGFDEESWKSYCQSLDQLRQQTFTLSQNQVKRLRSKLDNEATEKIGNGDVDEKSFHDGDKIVISQDSEFPLRQFKRRIGRAIHVEDSNIERQPSMGARPPRTRDSNVVIEITVQDPEESCSGKEEPEKIVEAKCMILEDGCSIENVEPETEKTSGYKSRDMAKDSVEENIQSPSASSGLKRLYDSGTGSSHVLQDSSSQGKGHKSKSDALCEGKIDAFSRGYSRGVETLHNSMEDADRNSTETNPCVAGIDVLFDDQIQSSPTPSDSDTWSKASEDIDHCDLRRTHDSQSSSVDSVLGEHQVPEYDHFSMRESDRNDVKMKDRAVKHHLRVKSPIEEDWKHRHQKLQKHSEPSSYNDKDDSYHIGSEPSSHSDKDDSYHIGIRRHVYDRSHFSAHRRRSKARPHALTVREDWPHYREKEPLLGCYDKRTVEHKTSCTREFRQWDRWGSSGEMDFYSPGGWDEDIFFSETRVQRTKGKFVESERYVRERECIIGDRVFRNQPHFPYQKKNQPRFTAKHPIKMEQWNLQWDYDDLRSSKRGRCDLSLEHGYPDGLALDRYTRFYPLNNREAEYLDLDLDLDLKSERHGRHIGRKVGTFGRGDKYVETPSLDFDRPWSIRDDDEDLNWQASRSTCHYPDKNHAYNERRRGFTACRDDVDDPSPFFKKHERHGRYISHRYGQDDKCLYDQLEAHDKRDNVRYLDEDDYIMKKQNDLGSNGVSLKEDTRFSRHFDNDFYDEDELASFEGGSRHNWHGTKNVLLPGWRSMHTQIMKHKQKIVRGGGGNSCDTNPKMPTEVEHQKSGVWCRNSVELRHFVRERKTVQEGGKCSNTRRNCYKGACGTADGRVQKQDEVYGSGTKNTKEFEAGSAEALHHAKLHVKNQDDTSDLEEGQIQTEEPFKEILKENKGGLKRMSINQKPRSQNDSNVYDENRILETMAKMEKRRERFKESILPKKEPDSAPKPQVAPVTESAESKQQRPVRKRRWGGS